MGTTRDLILSNLIALGLNNPSDSAVENKIADAIGIPVDNTITEMTNSENRILSIITSKNYGKSGYYTAAALAFQYGDNLIIDPVTLELVYATPDPEAQIIAQAAFEEIVSGNSAQLFLKVAAIDKLTGFLRQLSAAELAAFTNYFVNYELPGLPISIISLPANIINFVANMTYFATYDLTALMASVAVAMTTFAQSFKFNGEFFNGDLSDYLKAQVPGIRDAYFYNTTIDGIPFSGSKNLPAGYFNYDPNIATNLNYVPING